MRLAKSRVHFIGIGGIGMCGLAELLHNMGAQVTGSDLSEGYQTTRLRELGIPVAIGHRAENLKDCEVVVYSSAIPRLNPEFSEARKRKIPLIPRAEALAEMMRLRRGVAVGGSHGKTTTTSMCASIFLEGKLNPTIVVGGRLDLIKSTALLGTGEWLIAEADESDGSFSRLSPEIAVVTNIDNDHLDHYGTMEQVKKAFYDFASRIPFYGLAVACGDDANVREVFADFGKRIVTYGFSNDSDYIISGGRGDFVLTQNGQSGQRSLGQFQVAVPGDHNALNAAAAIVVGLEAGISFDVCTRGLLKFRGVDRRLQWKGSKAGVDVYDDYGHHPTEIRAVLAALREKFPGRKVVTVFQPHRYSRTKICWDQFLTCFENTDRLLILDIYPAGESVIPGVSSAELVRQILERQPAFKASFWRSEDDLANQLGPGDILLTLGAGDLWKLGESFLKAKP